MFERYFKDHITKLSFMLFIAIFFASATPRHTIEKKFWGIPFIYKFTVREEYQFPGVEITNTNVLVLVINVISIFLIFVSAWYIYRFVWQRINYFLQDLR